MMGIYIEGLDKQIQKGTESITVAFWDKDELIINEYDIGDMSKVTDLDLVRCGECRYYDPLDEDRPFSCEYDGREVNKTDFCSYGERNSNNNSNGI